MAAYPPPFFPHVELDAWVVMPNHVHGIIVIVDEPPGRGEVFRNGRSVTDRPIPCAAPLSEEFDSGNASPLPEPYPCQPSGSLGAIVGNFKSVTTRRINRIRKTPGARLWQRNYHDRVICDERGLIAVRRYIQENPIRWANDRNNPDRG